MAEDARRLAREKLAVATSPIRMAIASALSIEEASAAELGAKLGLPVEKVRYHLNRMRKAELVELRGKRRIGRVAENLYATDPRRFLIKASELAYLPPHKVAYANALALKLMFREAMAAARSGAFAERPEHALIRFPLALDKQGWEEAMALHVDLVEKISEARELSQSRLKNTGEQPTPASAIVLFFKRPPVDPT